MRQKAVMIVEPPGSYATVTGAIRQAARMTGADFKYLLATAQVESNLNPNARASTSSARGLFQFTEQTWLTTVKELGTAFGYGPYANAISRQPAGDYAVADQRMTKAVMNLRSDPTANALMAGAFTKANAGKLAGQLGRSPTEGELYIAHFLGATGAGRMIGLADSRPTTPAAAVFPSAARANPTIFYNARGNARSTGEVYRLLVGRYDVARGARPNLPTMATAADTDAGDPAAPRSAAAPDTASLAEAYAAVAPPSPTIQAGGGQVFHGLFRSTGGPEPVAPLVNSLWTRPLKPNGAAPAVTATATPPAPVAADGDLGLFQDQAPDARALFRGRV
jgi:hypothetical protein